MYRNLRDYIAALEAAGELARVTAPVDPVEEIAEITDRVSKQPGGGKALLFENTGTGFPVLTNMMGSDRRIALALGTGSLDGIAARIRQLLGGLTAPKEQLWDKLRMLPLLGEMSRWFPRVRRGRGDCQQVVLAGEAADLGKLPILKCWPWDGGRFVTLPLVHTVDPDTGARNVGMYRMQVMGADRTGMHWHRHKTGARHYEACKRRGERMPVSVCLGGDPAYTYAATAPMPDNMDEYLLAGFLRQRPVELVRCLTNGLLVPADCDFVIEGYVDPAEEKTVEGPFGDHTGFYSLEDRYPVFHVTAITHRRDAVYPATIVGVPPQEDAYIAKATERIFLEPIRFALQPEVADMYLPGEGVAHNLAVVCIRASYPGQAFKTAGALWGAGQMMFNKLMLVADTTDDIRDPRVLARLLRGVRVPDDLMRARGPLDVLDHATATPGAGGKLAVDATGAAGEAPGADGDAASRVDPGIAGATVDGRFAAEWCAVIVRCPVGEAVDAGALAARYAGTGVKYIVLADPATEGLTPGELVWFVAGNCDPGRDIREEDGLLVVDGRSKVPGAPGMPARWPNVVTSAAGTIALVGRRWPEYGLGAFVESPSRRYRELLRSDGAQAGATK